MTRKAEDAMDEIAWAAEQRPESEHGMSNFDQSVDDGLEADLRAGMHAIHSAWDFNGVVWYDPEAAVFCEAVRRYHVLVAVVSRPDLRELMHAVNDEWGWA